MCGSPAFPKSERERRRTRAAAVALPIPRSSASVSLMAEAQRLNRARRGAASGYVAHRAGGEKPYPACRRCREVRKRGDTARRTQAAFVRAQSTAPGIERSLAARLVGRFVLADASAAIRAVFALCCGWTMPIAVYFHPESMSAAQYDEIMQKLEDAEQGMPAARTTPPSARMTISCSTTSGTHRMTSTRSARH